MWCSFFFCPHTLGVRLPPMHVSKINESLLWMSPLCWLVRRRQHSPFTLNNESCFNMQRIVPKNEVNFYEDIHCISPVDFFSFASSKIKQTKILPLVWMDEPVWSAGLFSLLSVGDFFVDLRLLSFGFGSYGQTLALICTTQIEQALRSQQPTHDPTKHASAVATSEIGGHYSCGSVVML